MSKHNMLTDPLYISRQVLELIHQSDGAITATQIAEYIGITRSGLTMAMKRPHAMRNHARKTADFFKVGLGRLTGLADAQADRELPRPKIETSDPGTQSAPSVLEYICNNRRDDGTYAISPGCCVARLVDEDGRDTWVLLGPAGRSPRIGDKVLVTTVDLRQWVRLFNQDAMNQKRIVLMPISGDVLRQSPLTLDESEIKEMRLVIAPLDLTE
jgi:hypothetical protein